MIHKRRQPLMVKIVKKLLFKLKEDVKPDALSEQEVSRAKDYMLDEVTFVLVCGKMLRTDGFCYVYKEGWPVLEQCADGCFGGEKVPSVGFMAFHALPEPIGFNGGAIVTTAELAQLSADKQASNPHRPQDASKALLGKIVLPGSSRVPVL